MKLFLAILFVSLIGCSESALEVPEGAWAYQGYASNGAQITDGWFKIQSQDSLLISGNWRFERVGDELEVGPQIGSGQFSGQIDAEQIWINLNPDYADNNVFLSGIIDGDRMTGNWTWSGFAGPIATGSFSAQLN
jgi:hypothetical protein